MFMGWYVHADICVLIYTNTHTHTHTLTHTLTLTHTHSHSHSRPHTLTLTHTLTHTHSLTHTFSLTLTHTDILSLSHIYSLTHTHTHTHTHNLSHILSHSHAHSLRHSHTLSRAQTHMHTLSDTHTHSLSHTHTHSHSRTLSHTLTHTLTHTHTHSHTHSHSRTHTHTHTHTHTQNPFFVSSFNQFHRHDDMIKEMIFFSQETSKKWEKRRKNKIGLLLSFSGTSANCTLSRTSSKYNSRGSEPFWPIPICLRESSFKITGSCHSWCYVESHGTHGFQTTHTPNLIFATSHPTKVISQVVCRPNTNNVAAEYEGSTPANIFGECSGTSFITPSPNSPLLIVISHIGLNLSTGLFQHVSYQKFCMYSLYPLYAHPIVTCYISVSQKYSVTRKDTCGIIKWSFTDTSSTLSLNISPSAFLL
jgi:hypothetical protein